MNNCAAEKCFLREMKFKSQDQMIWALFFLWLVAVAVSITGYVVQWGNLPGILDTCFGVTLLAFFALPKSMSDLLHLTRFNSTQGTMQAVLVYWPVMGVLFYGLFKTKRIALFILLGFILLLSAWKWQVIATGMIGL